MRINDLLGNSNAAAGINNDLSPVDNAVLSENKKAAAPFDINKGAVGFFNASESKPAGSGRSFTYTFNEAMGKEPGDIASKIMSEAANGNDNDKELVKNLTGDDYEALEDEGMSIEKFSKERLERAIERIKENRKQQDVRLDETVEKQQEFKEAIERMGVNTRIDSGADRLIAKMLYEADIPVTKENIEEVKQAAGKAEEAAKLSDSSKGYLIKNSLQPTIENIYKATHSGEMRNMKLDDAAWDQLKGKALEIVNEAEVKLEGLGLKNEGVRESLTGNARWLIEHDIPLTSDNLVYKTELDGLTGSTDTDKEPLYRIAVGALREGLAADTALMIKRDDVSEKETDREMAEVIAASANISDTAIKLAFSTKAEGEDVSLGELAAANKAVEADKGSGVISAGVSESLTVREVKTRIRLEEVRISMNLEAGRRLMAKGINIISDSLLRVTEGIRELEKEYFRDLFKEIGADGGSTGAVKEAEEADIELAVKTEESLRTISGSPLELYKVTFSVRHSIVLGELSEKGSELKEATASEDVIKINPSSMKDALDRYESSATEIRKDLGDSIKKAFSGSVDSLLRENGLELTETNRRAVRILGYNSMEITTESITEIKYYDAKVTGLVQKMTPPVVMDMIRNGMNPLDMNIDELDSEVSKLVGEQGISKERSYGEFLVRMEETRSVTENERNAYIGVYRLLYNISKNDGAALGAALNSGKELSLRNLMTEVRSGTADIDFKVDDDTKQRVSYYSNSVTGQIDEAFIYQNSLLDKALSVTEPTAWEKALSGKDLGGVTLESLSENLGNAAVNTGSSEKAREIVQTMTVNSAEAVFLNSFGINDSFTNRNSIKDVLSGIDKEDTAAAVTQDELTEALTSASKTDELLGIKTRMANVLTGQAFKTAINAQAAAELNSRVERIEMLQQLAGKGHYRFRTEDEEGSKQVNLTLIRNTGNSGTVSVQISRPDYSVQADLNMTIMDAKYNTPSVKGTLHFSGKKGTADASGNMEALKRSFEEAGIAVEGLNVSNAERSDEGYIAYLSQLDRPTADALARADEMYKAAGVLALKF